MKEFWQVLITGPAHWGLVEWYVITIPILWIVAFIVLGWNDRNEPEEIVVVVALPLVWPLLAAALLLFFPFWGLWRVGHAARQRHDFLPKVLRRLGGNRA